VQIEGTIYEFSGFKLSSEEGRLERPDGTIIELSPKLLQLLLLFLESDGRVLTRDELIGHLWPDTAVEPTSLKQLIYSLRKSLGEGEVCGEIVKTLPRRGRFLGLVETLEQNGSESIEYAVTTVTVEQEEEIELGDSRADASPLPSRRLLGARQDGWRGWFVLPAFVLVIAVVIGGYLFWWRAPRPQLTSENITLQKLTHTDNLYWAMLSPNGQFVAYIALHKDGTQSLELLDVTTRTERTLVPPANVSYYGGGFTPDSSQLYYDTWDHADLTGKCILYQVPVLGDTPRRVMDNVAGPISFSPDGTRFIFSRRYADPPRTSLVSVNALDGSDEQIIASSPAEDDFRSPNWSPDGSRIVYISNAKTPDGVKWSVAEITPAGEKRTILGPTRQRLWGAMWLGDGSTILLSASAPDTKLGQLFTIAYPSGEMTRLTNDLNYYSGLSATADGKKVVVTQGLRTNDIWVSSLANPRPTKITAGSFVIDSIDWAPDGSIYYNISENGQHRLSSVSQDGTRKTSVLPPGIQGLQPDVSPDGKRMLFLSNRTGTWQVYLAGVDGSGMQQLTFEPEIVAAPRFVLDGNSVVFARLVEDRSLLTMMDLNGQNRRDISSESVGEWTVSHDLGSIAYSFYDLEQKKNRTVVRGIESGNAIAYFDLLPRDVLQFTPKDDGLLTKRYEPEADPMSTIWSFPLSGAPPSVFYQNPPDNIYDARTSSDGSHIAVVQGRVVSNLVLFSRSAQ
jgi:Tol biopolymer transport system component/DNA-binding winged helix-turn-helix (wHTH) protein